MGWELSYMKAHPIETVFAYMEYCKQNANLLAGFFYFEEFGTQEISGAQAIH